MQYNDCVGATPPQPRRFNHHMWLVHTKVNKRKKLVSNHPMFHIAAGLLDHQTSEVSKTNGDFASATFDLPTCSTERFGAGTSPRKVNGK